MLQADLQVVHDEFVDIVAKYRGLDRDKIATLADGSSMPGKRALENDLVDALGGREEARGFLATILETDVSEIHFCEYNRGFLPF